MSLGKQNCEIMMSAKSAKFLVTSVDLNQAVSQAKN